jgi:hypothetical protein
VKVLAGLSIGVVIPQGEISRVCSFELSEADFEALT